MYPKIQPSRVWSILSSCQNLFRPLSLRYQPPPRVPALRLTTSFMSLAWWPCASSSWFHNLCGLSVLRVRFLFLLHPVHPVNPVQVDLSKNLCQSVAKNSPPPHETKPKKCSFVP